jgi:hypothetical protein
MSRLIALAAAAAVTLVLICGGVLLFPAEASAAFNPFEQACNQGGGGPACNTNTNENPLLGQQGALSRVMGILSLLLGVVAVIYLIWGGIKYITSNGDSSSISSAKSTIIYALVGLVLAVLARPIINTVLSRI